MPRHLTVAQRVALLKDIFAGFGVPVYPGSALEKAILTEFGPGKRSKINKILLEYTQHTDAALLSACIGAELQRSFNEPEVLAVGHVLSDRMPSVLEIVDIRQQTEKREQILSEILTHFATKIPNTTENERLHRMILAASKQLHSNLQVQAVGRVVELTGTVFAFKDLQRCGAIMQALTPALIALDQPDVPISQITDHCVHAIRVMSTELQCLKLDKAAKIIDYVHWLAKINLPELTDSPTIEQALLTLEIPLGRMTKHQLQKKGKDLGLHDQELLQVLLQNQKHAATCGVIAKLGREIDCSVMEKIGISGLCLMTLRQTYDELRTNNLNAVNFSESLGIMVSGLGVVTNNDLLRRVGGSIANGVKTYGVLMGIPGGQAVAIPVAICAVLGHLLIHKRNPRQPSNILQKNIVDIDVLQRQMRWEFATLYSQLEAQHREVMQAMSQGFTTMVDFVARFQTMEVQRWQKIDDMHTSISLEFADLYLEYIRDPIEQLTFYEEYSQFDQSQLPKIKLKLNMWLLYKAKNPKANGRTLSDNVLEKPIVIDTVLGLVNRYINQEFDQSFTEELPHVPSWLQAAEAYMVVIEHYQDRSESRILQDIVQVGDQLLEYLTEITTNQELRQRIDDGIETLKNAQEQILAELTVQPEVQNLSKVANPAPAQFQHEKFAALPWDLSASWDLYNLDAIFLQAVQHKLGTVYAEYVINRNNMFTEVHLPYSVNLLPEHARYVQIHVNVYFKWQNNPQRVLIVSSKHSYDLGTVQNRFEQYYRSKFKYPLKHINYEWIAIDGMLNQVGGHPVTSTHKLIDYDRLATVYQQWFGNSSLQNIERVDCDALINQLQTEVRICVQREATMFLHAQQNHPCLAEIQNKLAAYQNVLLAIEKLSDQSLKTRIDYTVTKLKMLQTNCDIMPILALSGVG